MMNHINPLGFFPLEHTKIGNDFPSPLEVETLVYVGEGKGNFNKDRELEDPHGPMEVIFWGDIVLYGWPYLSGCVCIQLENVHKKPAERQ